MRKFLLVLIVLMVSILFPTVLFGQIDNGPDVTVVPNGTGALGQWTFTVPRNSILLIEGESVMGFTIVFPNGTVLPGSIATQHITVNGQQSSGILVNPSRREVIFTTPIGFPIYNEITVTISSLAGILSPPPSLYTMELLPLRGTMALTTKFFEIKTVSDPIQATPGKPLTDKVIKVTLNDPVVVRDGLAVVLDAPPQLINGITMVPLCFVSEVLVAGVVYNDAQNMITVTLGGRRIDLWIDARIARVDGEFLTLAATPIIQNGQPMVPLRFVSECFGAKVDFAGTIATITMTANALSNMPTVGQIQASQTTATTSGGDAEIIAGTPLVGQTITLGSGITYANLRNGPSETYDIIGLLLPTETAKVIEILNNWCHVEFSYGMQAWVQDNFIMAVEEFIADRHPVGQTITLGAGMSYANLRNGPSETHDIIGLLLPAEMAKVIDVSGDWYQIEFYFGLQAWVRIDLVMIVADINNDGHLDMVDVLHIYQYFRGKVSLSKQQLFSADVNNDGIVNLQDVLLTYQYFTIYLRHAQEY